MRPIHALRSLFSPYEISAGGIWLNLVFLVAMVVAIFTARGLGAVLALAAMGGIAFWAGYNLGRCPNCGKPALKFFLSGNEEAWEGLLFIRRWWPERECSSCRTPLDVI